jgi:hypothetical protein
VALVVVILVPVRSALERREKNEFRVRSELVFSEVESYFDGRSSSPTCPERGRGNLTSTLRNRSSGTPSTLLPGWSPRSGTRRTAHRSQGRT